MAKGKKSYSIEDLLTEQNTLLRNQTIITLSLAGVPQSKIREIVGVDIGHVNKIAKHIKKAGAND